VIDQPAGGFPACNVALIYQDRRLGQLGRVVHLRVRARTGMSLPLLTSPRRRAEADARHGRGGMDERRPAPPVRHPGAPTRPYGGCVQRAFAARPSSCGCRPGRHGHDAQAQVVADFLSQEPAPHAERIRSPSLSTAAECRAGLGPRSP
jgi:hypothetical protein